MVTIHSLPRKASAESGKCLPNAPVRRDGGAQLPLSPHLFPPQPSRTQTSHSPSAYPLTTQPALYSQQGRFVTHRFTRTFSNPTSSAPETALVCQSRTSKLSTRSRKRMKIPARSSRVSRTTFTFVSNVRCASPSRNSLSFTRLFVAPHMQTSPLSLARLHTCTRRALPTRRAQIS
jgi:hypothetical protein